MREPESYPAGTELLGATRFANEGMRLANAGEFACEWNLITPEQREDWWASITDAMEIRSKLLMRRLYVTTRPPLTIEQRLEQWRRETSAEIKRRFDELDLAIRYGL